MTPPVHLRPLEASDHAATAELLHRSLVHWYETRLRQGARFGDSAAPFRLFPDVYAALDPGQAVAAYDPASGALLGVCFVHPRRTHIALGIVATAPEAQGRGVARAMLEPVLADARRTGRPARLVSSLLNLDSFSLYSRLGFAPHTIYQDIALTVPPTGLGPLPSGAGRVRRVTDPAEASRLAEIELTLQGIHREPDYAFFLRNPVGDWRVWALDGPTSAPGGFLVASHHPGCLMLGPGVAADEAVAIALLARALDELRGRTVVFLVPCAARAVVQACYAWGGRNVELHAAQTTGVFPTARGVAFPTFLPESG